MKKEEVKEEGMEKGERGREESAGRRRREKE